MATESVQEHLKRIDLDGYTIVEDAIEPELLEFIANELARIERERNIKPARNNFEGFKTTHVYNLLVYGKAFEAIPVHPKILPIVEGVLGDGLLISTLSSISIGPGEAAQAIHADDILIPLDKPHRAIVCNTMWALTDFTDENGATRIIPGTHKSDRNPEYGKQYDTIPAVMKRGSVLVWNGSLWHGGGANRTTDQVRVGIAMNYCAGYIRQQENQQLGIPREIAARFSPKLKDMVGYGVYRGLIGHIDKHSPANAILGDPETQRNLFDRT
ncbi:MAG TPA: phytanoyl-CoA dioxygenase family protein [Candidatus Binataceae bacterium]|nr:phytanoyl-CoA dioxygenase family protein [Candidatus Binataceae bacterium]